jgi:hypothetical protein
MSEAPQVLSQLTFGHCKWADMLNKYSVVVSKDKDE